jgi:ribbon-helix-helix CopG family protein
MSATRTQVYLTAEQRAALDQRADVERKTMAHVIRDAIDSYLAGDLDDQQRSRAFADTFGSCSGLAERIPSREEWGDRVEADRARPGAKSAR